MKVVLRLLLGQVVTALAAYDAIQDIRDHRDVWAAAFITMALWAFALSNLSIYSMTHGPDSRVES